MAMTGSYLQREKKNIDVEFQNTFSVIIYI